VVAGRVKICETVLCHIGDKRDFFVFGFVFVIFYTNGKTHVTIATVSISDNIAAGKSILQLADNTWSMRNLAKRVVMYSVTITIANSLSTNHKEYQNAGNPKNTGPYGPPRNNS